MNNLESSPIYLIYNNTNPDRLQPLERLNLSQWSLAGLAQRLMSESDPQTKPIMLSVMMCLYALELKTKIPTTREMLVSSFTTGGVKLLIDNPLIEDKDKEVLEIAIGSWTPYRKRKKSFLRLVGDNI